MPRERTFTRCSEVLQLSSEPTIPKTIQIYLSINRQLKLKSEGMPEAQEEILLFIFVNLNSSILYGDQSFQSIWKEFYMLDQRNVSFIVLTRNISINLLESSA